jgi:hypothetical protein
MREARRHFLFGRFQDGSDDARAVAADGPQGIHRLHASQVVGGMELFQ